MSWTIQNFPLPSDAELQGIVAYVNENYLEYRQAKADTYTYGWGALNGDTESLLRYSQALATIETIQGEYNALANSDIVWNDGTTSFGITYLQYIVNLGNYLAFQEFGVKFGYGTTGDDTDTLGAGWNNYVINYYGGNDSVTVASGTHRVLVNLGDGNDTFTGSDGSDGVFGGEGNDILRGGGNVDVLDGGPGEDKLFGESGNDLLYGGSGDDILDGGSGNDFIDGGSGFDTAFYSGKFSEYNFSINADGLLTILDTIEQRDSKDTLTGVEVLFFDDLIIPSLFVATTDIGTLRNRIRVLPPDISIQEGTTLIAPEVVSDEVDTTYSGNLFYQWYKGGNIIAGATASTYAVPASGAGTYKVGITYTDAQGFTATVDSPDQVISKFNNGNGTPGAINGTGVFQEGVTITAPLVTGDPDGDATNPNYSYQWFKGSTAITNSTASTYAVPVTGAGTYKVAVTYTDAQGFIATLDSPEQVVIKPTAQQVDIAPSQRGSLFRVESAAALEMIVNLKGSSDLIEIRAEVSATLNAVTTENWGTGYVAWNVGSTIQAGTGERVSLNGLGKYSFVATAINAATSTIVLEQGKNSAFFLHDAYSAFYEGLTLSTDSTGRQSAARILDFDVIKMGSAGGNSIVDLTSKDYITGAVTVHGTDNGRSIFWGTDSDDTFLSGGGDSVIFGGGGFNQSILGAGKDILQFRSTVDSANRIQGFDRTKDVLEFWRGKTETVEAPSFMTQGNSTRMTWGNNIMEFEGITGLSTESLMITTRIAL